MLPNYGCLLGEHPRKPGADAYSKDIFLLLKLHCIRSKRLYGYNLHIPSETLPDISRFVLDHGIGGVAAGAHHQVGPEFIQNGPGLPPRLGQRNHGHDIVLDVLPFPGPVDGVHVDGAQLIALMGHQRPLHPVVRSGEENLAALMPELEEPGQRDGRIDMPRGTAAGKEYLQGNTFSNRPWGPGFVLTRSARCPSPAAGSAGPCPRN